jgi:hypothetical protein
MSANDDVILIRQIADALSDPARRAITRKLIQRRVGERPYACTKALRGSAPLDGIGMNRDSERGRNIDL